MNPTLRGMTLGMFVFLLIVAIALWATVIVIVMWGGCRVLHLGTELMKSRAIGEKIVAAIMFLVGFSMILVGFGLILLSIVLFVRYLI